MALQVGFDIEVKTFKEIMAHRLGDTVSVHADLADKYFPEQVVRTLVSTSRGSVSGKYNLRTRRVHWCPAPWTGSWWARLLRWLNAKIGIPRPLEELVNAKALTVTYTTQPVPEDLADRIAAQAAYLRVMEEQPLYVLVGPGDAKYRLQSGFSFDYHTRWNLGPLDEVKEGAVFGIPIRTIPWLKDDEVMVV